jgi:sugar lactone lactonase YvrE
LWVAGQAPNPFGYTVLTATVGNTIPVGSALFSYTNSSGVLVTQAGIGAAEPIRSGRIFVDEAEAQTGIALVNDSPQDATGTLILRDSSGAEIGRRPLALGARQRLAQYVAELFPLPPNFTGSLTFDSNQPLAAITLRESRNAQGEPLYTTLPVVDLGTPAGNQPIVFPQIAAGEGYTTHLVLINSGAVPLRGRVRLVASSGQPLPVRFQGNTVTDFTYEIAPQGTYRADLDGESLLLVGYAVVSSDAGPTPAGTAIFRLQYGSRLMAEAGVAAIAATRVARTIVDYIGAQTGVAVANPGDLPAELTLTLMDRYGVVEATAIQTLQPRNHLSRFVHELFPAVAAGYTGLMEIRSSNDIVPLTLKLTVNARNDLVLTTLPLADLTRPSTATTLVFPHIALGSGFSTRLIFLNASTSNTSSGSMTFYRSDGNLMEVPMGGQTASQFGYRMVEGGGRQFYPGNNASVASVSLVEPLSNRVTNEVVINEGNTVRPRLLILDSTGVRRDDFDAEMFSYDASVAPVVEFGGLQGRKAGFSTLTITVGGHIIAATATVVKVDSSGPGFGTTGIAQDPARRLYLASTEAHSILLAQDLKQRPEEYAGITGTAGLKNDRRRQSLFNGPSFLALNQADGSLYVSDGANHVIRRVSPGLDGRVETLAGTGVAGSRDGALNQAMFNNPQGIALDGVGNLWISDSGNHVIRRINLVTRIVETIAGRAGNPGSTDGRGGQARFRSPTGIAIETETSVQQLARERSGALPPPVTVVVADTGNGLIRRLRETGEVETISTPVRFTSPAGVAVDPAGTIYISEPVLGQVKAILQTREVVPAAQAGTFVNPRGIVVAQNGRVVVAGRDRAARELLYGEPQIASINPGQVSNRGGQKITVTGSNFAPGTLVVVAGVEISNPTIVDTQTITFIAPALPSGRGTLTVQNRGGLAQKALLVDAVPLNLLPVGFITTVAGGSTFAGEGAPARTVPIDPLGIAVDANGNMFIADGANRRVRRVDGRTGIITTVAGNGQGGRSGDNGSAIAARLGTPNAVAFDPAGNLLISASGIRRVDAITGIITTVVGGEYGYCGDGGNALDACLTYVTGITVDGEGNLFIADAFDHRIRRVDGRTNIITTIAGNGRMGLSGDTGDAKAASLNTPLAVAVDDLRKLLYIADAHNDVIRKVDLATNIITTVVGGLDYPSGLAVDAAGNLLISDGGHRQVRKFDIATGIIATVAGSGSAGSDGDGGPATAASLADPRGLAVDAAGNILIADAGAFVVRRVDATSQIITTLAGNRQRVVLDDDVPATAATLGEPAGVTVDAGGNLLINDPANRRIRRVDATTGIIKTIAGGGRPETGIGDGAPATNALLSGAGGRVGLDVEGNIYIADRYHYRVRKIDIRTGIITTVAGNGQFESSGDGGPATAAGVLPDDVALDRQGNLYIAETETRRVRKVILSSGVITTVAGGGLSTPGLGDNGPATRAVLGSEFRIAAHPFGNLFIADTDNGRVRKVDFITQYIDTVAGGGSLYGENLPATSVGLLPVAVDVDAAGNLFIADFGYPLSIRKVSAATGLIRIVAGADRFPELGDNGPAIAAFLFYPYGVAVDAHGNLFIADTGNQRIRAVRGPIP